MNKHFMAGSNFPWSSVRLQVLISFITLTQVIRPLGKLEKECLALQHSLLPSPKLFMCCMQNEKATQMTACYTFKKLHISNGLKDITETTTCSVREIQWHLYIGGHKVFPCLNFGRLHGKLSGSKVCQLLTKT